MNKRPTLSDIPGILKNPVLLPLNGKKPFQKDWSKFTYEYTQSRAYQGRLKQTVNIGVLLGNASNHLYSIDFDTNAWLEWFLENNPELADSFRVVGARGAQIYLYIEGERPNQTHFLEVPEEHFLAVGAKKKKKPDGMSKIGEFRADGGQSVLVGKHPDSTPENPIWYSWPVDNPPLTIAFKDINWHPEIVLPWAAKVHSNKQKKETNSGSGHNGDHEADGEPGGREAIQEATEVISIDYLWRYFGFPVREKQKNGEYVNPVSSPFRKDDNPSFSIYLDEKGKQKFRDHGLEKDEEGGSGDSFDFYQHATEKDSHEAFPPFMQLAEWVAGGEEIPPYSRDSEEAKSSADSAGSNDAGESEEEALGKKTREAQEWYGKKTTSAPTPIREEAFIGIIGKWVKIAATYTECNRDNLLVQFLVCLGILFGRYHYNYYGRKLFTNEFLTVLGDSGSAKKGSALDQINDFLTLIDPTWLHKITDGVPSGEAIIHIIRDKIEGMVRGVLRVKDEGVSDKRALIAETELSQLFKISARQGNTLTTNLRKAWDSPDVLKNPGKTSPETATGPHIGMIGHITEAELKTTDPANISNGLINRGIYVYVFQAQEIPNPEPIQWPEELVAEFAETIRLAQAPSDISIGELNLDRPDPIKEIPLDEEAKLLWNKIYYEHRPTNELTKRYTSHVRKIAEIYALLFRSSVITSAHLLAGVAIMDHSDECVLSVFADFSSNKLANKIMTALNRAYPKGLTKKEIHNHVTNRNAPAAELDEALAHLLQNKLAGLVVLPPQKSHPTLDGNQKTVPDPITKSHQFVRIRRIRRVRYIVSLTD